MAERIPRCTVPSPACSAQLWLRHYGYLDHPRLRTIAEAEDYTRWTTLAKALTIFTRDIWILSGVAIGTVVGLIFDRDLSPKVLVTYAATFIAPVGVARLRFGCLSIREAGLYHDAA